jgi:plastocyanin
MKWYGYILIAALLFVILTVVRAPAMVETSETIDVPVAFIAVQDTQVNQPEKQGVERQYDIYVVGNEFIPVTYEAEAGDTIRLTLVSDVEDETIDFQLPELNIVEELDAGDSVEFVVPHAGNYDFFCMTCGPAMQGNILVHE